MKNNLSVLLSWWRHQMETFSVFLVLCAGNSPLPDEFPSQRPVTQSFDVSFDLRLNKRLSKQSWGWWFETPSRSLWRHCKYVCVCVCMSLAIYISLSFSFLSLSLTLSLALAIVISLYFSLYLSPSLTFTDWGVIETVISRSLLE